MAKSAKLEEYGDRVEEDQAVLRRTTEAVSAEQRWQDLEFVGRNIASFEDVLGSHAHESMKQRFKDSMFCIFCMRVWSCHPTHELDGYHSNHIGILHRHVLFQRPPILHKRCEFPHILIIGAACLR